MYFCLGTGPHMLDCWFTLFYEYIFVTFLMSQIGQYPNVKCRVTLGSNWPRVCSVAIVVQWAYPWVSRETTGGRLKEGTEGHTVDRWKRKEVIKTIAGREKPIPTLVWLPCWVTSCEKRAQRKNKRTWLIRFWNTAILKCTKNTVKEMQPNC